MTEELLAATAARLLAVTEARLTRLPGGGNNRLYRVDSAAGPAVLKHYFRHPADPRDRLDAEFRLCTYAWESGLRALPRPLGRDDSQGVGLYAFQPGQRVTSEGIDGDAIAQALAFLRALQGGRDSRAASALPAASEACFSQEEHVRMLEGRMTRLEGMEGTTAVDWEAQAFVGEELRPAWEALRRTFDGASETPLPPGERVISPSDFGFHNALRSESGRYAFLDFEYAGWDDPAKLVCDFFCQVAVPVPLSHFTTFAQGVAELGPEPGATRARIHSLFPLYRLKWCCILLNPFLPVDLARRSFARPDTVAAKALQLAQARALLHAPSEP
ncbi:MAG: aminoglycoside phosphotransferase family protein [Acidobacteria bacterium]|nr:aminoglycoside phosphotransferase family protein [Acidobacteriota bacterium]